MTCTHSATQPEYIPQCVHSLLGTIHFRTAHVLHNGFDSLHLIQLFECVHTTFVWRKIKIKIKISWTVRSWNWNKSMTYVFDDLLAVGEGRQFAAVSSTGFGFAALSKIPHTFNHQSWDITNIRKRGIFVTSCCGQIFIAVQERAHERSGSRMRSLIRT